MASKKYAYYLKGNKVAIVQEEHVGSGGNLAVAHCTLGGYTTKDTCEAAGGQWIPSSSSSFSGNRNYVSPTSSVTGGIEVEYTYIPNYILPQKNLSVVAANRNFFRYIGWTSVNGYLSLITSGEQDYGDFISGGLAFAGSPHYDNYIVIEGSERWNGLHKIQETQAFSSTDGSTTHGTIKTYTKVPDSLRTFYDNSVTWVTDETITGLSNTSYSSFHSLFLSNIDSDITSTNDPTYPSSAQTSFIYISGSDGGINNNGLFTNWKMTSETVLDFSEATKYVVNSGSDLDVTTTTGSDISFAADATNAIYIYEAFLDPGFIYSKVNVLSDEQDEIDLTSYQSKALVYYLKAKMAEDAQDIKTREFFMREFRRHLEKERSARKRGPYITMGNANMRNY